MEIWSQMGHSDVECQLPKRYLEGSFFFLMGLLVSEQILFSINPDLWCNNPCARCNQWISDPVSPWVFAGIQRSQLLAEHVLCQVSFSAWGNLAVGRNPLTKDTKPTRPWKEATPRCFHGWGCSGSPPSLKPRSSSTSTKPHNAMSARSGDFLLLVFLRLGPGWDNYPMCFWFKMSNQKSMKPFQMGSFQS